VDTNILLTEVKKLPHIHGDSIWDNKISINQQSFCVYIFHKLEYPLKSEAHKNPGS